MGYNYIDDTLLKMIGKLNLVVENETSDQSSQETGERDEFESAHWNGFLSWDLASYFAAIVSINDQ